MRPFILATSLFLFACGGDGGTDEDTSTDQPQDTIDTQGDAHDTDGDTAPDEMTDSATDDTAVEVECASNMDCDDTDPCTVDSCDIDFNDCSNDAVDADGDGYPAMEVGGTSCAGGTDCDDSDGSAYPGSLAIDCSSSDHDCNDEQDRDNDGDGLDRGECGGDDCDDGDAGIMIAECTGINACCDGCTSLGCWLDDTTGYLWENPPTASERNWYSAVSYCDALALAGLGAGAWHLPTISEQRTLLRGCPESEESGGCGVTDSCLGFPCYGSSCGGCPLMGGPGEGGCYWDPAIGGTCSWSWSSSPVETTPAAAWAVQYDYGSISDGMMSADGPVRCVHSP